MAAEAIKTVRVSLDPQTFDHMRQFCKDTSQTADEYVASALYLSAALMSQGVSDGSTPFLINDELYDPPHSKVTDTSDRLALVRVAADEHRLAKAHARDRHHMGLGGYLTRCTVLLADMQAFGVEESARLTNEDNGIQLVSLVPFMWDDLV
jgi:hypothetical protein